ncbi:TPA: type I toxin-antitoxin system Ibs family toxin [Escherichia coli]|nr:type I toxin-antitoxin system Ibs family toxin [Escherichia coli]
MMKLGIILIVLLLVSFAAY